MTAADEQQLIRDAKAGSGTAFRYLVERHMKQTYNLAFSLVGDHQSAEDVAQDAFVRAYESLREFRGDAEFSTWLYRITVNLSLNRIKHMKRRREREEELGRQAELVTATTNDQDDLLMVDQPVHIERALHELPTLQRAVVILRHLNGLSTKQVGAILQCSEGTVKTHLHRGLKKLRSRLRFLAEDLI